MEATKLVQMANQIAQNFRTLPDDEAVAAVTEHLRSFWAPSMRRALVDHAKHSAAELVPVVQRALALLT